MKKRLRLAHALILLLYTLLTALMTWPLTRNLASTIPGDSFDGWQNYWNLWWVKTALLDKLQSPLTTDLLYAPTGVSLYFHTLNPFNGLVTLPVQLAGSLILAYNAVVFISWVLGGYGMFLLTRWLLRPKNAQPVYGEEGAPFPPRFRASAPPTFALAGLAPPFLAGLIYTFAPFHMAHLLGHMQVMSLQWLPFYVLALLRALDRRRAGRTWLREALLAGFFLTLVGLCDWYFVLYLFFLTGLLIVWHWVADTLRTSRHAPFSHLPIMALRSLVRWAMPPLLAGLLFLLLLSPMLIPMLQEAVQFDFMVRPPTDLYILSASLADFVIPNRLHTLFRPESFSWLGNQIAPVSERTIAIGYLPLLLAALGAGLDRKRSGFWLASALFFLALALGPVVHWGNITQADVPTLPPGRGPLTWSLFGLLNRSVPFMSISRSVSRYALMVQFAVAVLSAIGLASLLRFMLGRTATAFDTLQAGPPQAGPSKVESASAHSVRPQLASAAAVLCCGIVLFEYWVAPFPLSPPDTPAFYQELRTMPGEGSVLNLPMNYDRPGYLLYQTVHQKALAVAYISRDDPRTLTERAPLLQHWRHLGPDILAVDPAQVGPTVLNDLQIDFVVLDRYKMPGGLERTYTEALAQSVFGNMAPLFEDERLTVYKVADVPEPQPYMVLGPLNWGPLQQEPEGHRFRTLLEGAATLRVYHARADQMALRLRYRTSPVAVLQIADKQGVTRSEEPDATGTEIVLPLVQYGAPQPDGSLEITLKGMGELNGVEIEEVALVALSE